MVQPPVAWTTTCRACGLDLHPSSRSVTLTPFQRVSSLVQVGDAVDVADLLGGREGEEGRRSRASSSGETRPERVSLHVGLVDVHHRAGVQDGEVGDETLAGRDAGFGRDRHRRASLSLEPLQAEKPPEGGLSTILRCRVVLRG